MYPSNQPPAAIDPPAPSRALMLLEARALPELGAFYQGVLPDGVSEPEDIAAAVAWIASDEARHITGIQLPVDLGRTNR